MVEAGHRKSHRFLIESILKSIDFERRAGSGESGDRKTIDFSLKTFRKVSILYPGSLGTVSGRFWGPRGEKIIEENIGSVQNLRRLLGIRWQA